MILGCHREKDTTAHRKEELRAAWAQMVEVARQQGLPDAFRASHPNSAALSDDLLERTFMVPWFLRSYVLNPPDLPTKPLFAEHVAKLDLGPVREAEARAKAIEDAITAERDALRRGDDWRLDDHFMGSQPPEGLEQTVVRNQDGRPRPVFHVTPESFEAFRSITHFGSALAVSRHAESLAFEGAYERLDVHACWLDIRNPVILEDAGSKASTWLISKAQEAGVIDSEEMKWITGHPDPLGIEGRPDVKAVSHPRRLMLDNLAKILISKGYDGIRYENAVEGGGTSWVNLRADQVIVDRVMKFDVVDDGFELSAEEADFSLAM